MSSLYQELKNKYKMNTFRYTSHINALDANWLTYFRQQLCNDLQCHHSCIEPVEFKKHATFDGDSWAIDVSLKLKLDPDPHHPDPDPTFRYRFISRYSEEESDCFVKIGDGGKEFSATRDVKAFASHLIQLTKGKLGDRPIDPSSVADKPFPIGYES
jgi:hypothetical protein